VNKWTKVAIGAVAMALTVGGCGSKPATSAGGTPRTLTVWLMDGSAPAPLTEALNKEFESAHSGVKVNYEVQQWKGIQDKLTTALASKAPPDVIEIGNTQTAKFAADQVVLDVTADAKDFQGDQWLQGLKDSATIDGKQYAVPFYAANRTVLYRKDMFAAAGITTLPTSQQEWLAAIDKLKAANANDPDFQALYLPGQSWYDLLSFIWDNGGDIAKQQGKSWQGALDTPAAKAGFQFYKTLVDASATKAPKDVDEATPQQGQVYGQGHVAMMIGLPWEVATAAKTDPKMKELTAAFPIPSKTAGKTAPVFLGGSNLAIPANSKNQDLAKDYLKLMSSKKYQDLLAKSGAVPGTSTDISALASDPVAGPMAKAAQNGKVTPTSPKWATIEAGQNPLKDALTAMLTGTKSVDQATADANKAINQALSG
jgi:N,N'-diacetylchitobiose transport system substrate-binding protein